MTKDTAKEIEAAIKQDKARRRRFDKSFDKMRSYIASLEKSLADEGVDLTGDGEKRSFPRIAG